MIEITEHLSEILPPYLTIGRVGLRIFVELSLLGGIPEFLLQLIGIQ